MPVSLIFIDAISLQLTNQATKASLKGLLKQIFIYINIPVIYLEFQKNNFYKRDNIQPKGIT